MVNNKDTSSKPILTVENLKTEFITQEGVVNAVNGISYTLEKGKTLGVVGESGCGKSVSSMSLLKLIPIPPGVIRDGKVIFEGKDLLRLTEEELEDVRGKKISVIFQDPTTSLNPYMKVGEQISEMLRYHLGYDKSTAKAKSIELLNQVRIPQAERRMDAYPFELSGGMRQRVMIAIALACEPQIIIADEPTTDLDVTIQAQILELMKDIKNKRQLSMILITHDIGIVAEICDEVIVMYAGYIVEKGSVGDIISNPHHPYTKNLIESIPFLEKDIARLSSIEGSPPDLLNLSEGCPYYERCGYRIDKCKQKMPDSRGIEPNHTIRCRVDID